MIEMRLCEYVDDAPMFCLDWENDRGENWPYKFWTVYTNGDLDYPYVRFGRKHWIAIRKRRKRGMGDRIVSGKGRDGLCGGRLF